MKKLRNILLCGTLLAVTACSANTSSLTISTTTITPEQNIEEKTVIVYFSATGHTEQVVQYLEAETNADIFIIEPTEPYTSEDLNYNDANSRVTQEHENEDLQDVSLSIETPENWESYSIVYLGYPIWWGGAAWPVTSFVKKNDFTNKTIISFCTSASSSLGSSADDLANIAGTGNWLEGKRFSSSVSESEVQDWIISLNFE